MATVGILCTLSEPRVRILGSNPDLIRELIDARLDSEIPGLLDLGETWDALDYLLSERGVNVVLGDAILARRGVTFGPALGAGAQDGSGTKARILSIDQVREVNDALKRLPDAHISSRYADLRGRDIQGGYGASPEDAAEEIEELEEALDDVKDLFQRAADQGHAMLSVLV
jgi:hypothetical protein